MLAFLTKCLKNVSIPQAVGVVATKDGYGEDIKSATLCFNTAGGRCCCNATAVLGGATVYVAVSIPQAVGVVATPYNQHKHSRYSIHRFNTAGGRCCCNSRPYRASIHGA